MCCTHMRHANSFHFIVHFLGTIQEFTVSSWRDVSCQRSSCLSLEFNCMAIHPKTFSSKISFWLFKMPEIRNIKEFDPAILINAKFLKTC